MPVVSDTQRLPQKHRVFELGCGHGDAASLVWVAQVGVVDDANERKLLLEADGEGNWLRDGVPSSELQGCLDVDIAATPFTNTFVIRRLGLSVGETAEIRAAWGRGSPS